MHTIIMNNYLILANTKYPTIQEVRKFQKWVNSDPRLVRIDQEWADTYHQPLADFMGDPLTIVSYFNGSSKNRPNVIVRDRTTLRTNVEHSTVGFSKNFGASGHWYSRMPGDSKAFDPYTEFQYQGTNQFCQTYSWMYQAHRLPDKVTGTWTKYYSYTVSALKFIKHVLESFPTNSAVFSGTLEDGNKRATKKQLLKCVNECIKYPNICVNIIQSSP
jgi:hypothetical protein